MIAVMVVLLAAAMAALTWTIGWWGVPLAALLAGALWRGERGRAGLVALAAALAWGALLAVDALGGRLGALATLLGGIFPAPGVALLGLTLLFAAAGAWSAAVIGAALRAFVDEAARRPRASSRDNHESTEVF